MNNDIKKPTAKEAVKDQIASNLWHIESRITDMSEKMNSNYIHFFEWQAEEMFKVQKRREFHTALSKAIDETYKDTDLTTWLLAIAYRKVNDIARNSLTRSSTSQMANIAHLLNLQAEQEMIRDLESLAHVAEYYSK